MNSEEKASTEQFKYLWDGSSSDWVLVHVNFDKPDETAKYVIDNVAKKYGLDIEDDQIYHEVVTHMLKAGVPVITAQMDPIERSMRRNLAKWLSSQRSAYSLSVKQLAKRVNLSPRQILRLEKGELPITWQMLVCLAAAFSITPDNILVNAELHDSSPSNKIDWLWDFDRLSSEIQDHIIKIVKN